MIFKSVCKLNQIYSRKNNQYYRIASNINEKMSNEIRKSDCNGVRSICFQTDIPLKKVKPSFTLQDYGDGTSLYDGSRLHLCYADIQNFILTSNGMFDMVPSRMWFKLKNSININRNVLIVVEGMELNNFRGVENPFVKLSPVCNAAVEFKNHEIVTNFADAFYNFHVLKDLNKVVLNTIENIPCTDFRKNGVLRRDLQHILDTKDQFNRVKLLLSRSHFSYSGLVMPSSENDFKFSRLQYEKVGPNSPMFAIDCEMVTTLKTLMQYEVELAKISIVDENLKLIYSTMIKPRNAIVDYVTRVNGITQSDLFGVTTRLEDVQHKLAELLPADAILVGHGLGNDMRALKLSHPYCIDTSHIFNVTGSRYSSINLKKAAKLFLKTAIRQSNSTHDSTEDACISMLLAKLKLTNNVDYGDFVNGWTGGNKHPNENIDVPKTNMFELFSNLDKVSQPTVILSSELSEQTFKTMNEYSAVIKKNNTKQVMNKVMEILTSKTNVIAHIQVGETEELSKRREVDEYLYKLYSSLPVESILTVLVPCLKSDNKKSTGYAFISLKK